MINQKAIDAFLNRPVDNFGWLKNVSIQQLEKEIAELGDNITSLKLWKHQQACLLMLLEIKRFMLHIDMGGGKTLLTLALLRHRKAMGQKPRAIVFVPYLTAIDTWIQETAKHTPELTCVPLLGTAIQNRATLAGPGDLFVACYQSAVALTTGRDKPAKGHSKWVLKASDVRQHFPGFDTMVCDEIQKCKSVTSLTYRMCRALSKQCDWVIGLTGTPFGRDLLDLWPQFYLVDGGAALGPTLGFYREVFFKQEQKYWGGNDFKFKKKLLPDLKRLMQHSSISYGIDELVDMPPVSRYKRKLTLPDGIKGYVDKAAQQLKEAISNKQLSGNYYLVESSYLQLRQLSSGFMTFKGEDSDKVQVDFPDNPKLDALSELVEALPDGCKMVVFHHFQHTNKVISDHLTSMKVKHARVYGKSKDPLGELKRFRDDPDCKILVINSRSGSASLNLQNANFVVFFEQPDSAIDRQQAERRTWRPGQTKRVYYYDLIMEGTVDERMFQANKAGENLLKQLLERGL
jgi:SNF2 family DNA or RNA helicase